MKEFVETVSRLVDEYGTDVEKGLSTSQAEINLGKYGANRLTPQKRQSLLRRIWDAATEPMILMLIGAGLIALAVNIYRSVTGGEADYWECVGVFVAISLSVVISVVMEGRSAKAFEALSKISDNVVVKAVRDGKTVLLSQREIVVGDILILSVGDKIPADGRLISSNGLYVDESALTGESVPVQKDANAVLTDHKTPLAERINMLYSGTYITAGNCHMVVTSVGDRTEFGCIASELNTQNTGDTPLQIKLAKMGKMITLFGVIAAVVVFVAQLISFALHGGLVLDEVMEAFVTSIVLIVAAVPEGLPTIVAVALSINIIKLSRRNALVKKMIASETIGCINVICSDKTGTLTENKMTVCAYYDQTLHNDCTDLVNAMLINNMCINSTADIGEQGQFVGNPTECAMLNFYSNSKAYKDSGKSYTDIRRQHKVLHSFPFSSELKHMTTVAQVDGNVIAFTKGSPEAILAMCNVSPSELEDIQLQISNAQNQAMRVIAFAHKQLGEMSVTVDWQAEHDHMESGMTFDGFVAIADPLRKEVYEAVKSCATAGIELKILTGDNILTATAIANQLHLLDSGKKAVEAKDIADLTDQQLSDMLQDICVIARSTPTIKMRVVKLLKAQGNVVAVTGDGINDAPALKNADVGVAMGISGTEVSKEACDIVLLDDSFATIVRAVEWGRNIYENFKRFITFQLTVNYASVVVVLCSILFGLSAPFTALELLWINIIMDGPPALTLGLEPNYKDLMDRQPTKRNESIISKAMLLRIILTGTYVSVIFLCQYLFNFLQVDVAEQSTVLFTLFVLFQLFNSFNCRELHKESIFKHLFSNKVMLCVVGITFVLQVLFIQFAGALFGTVPLSLITWCKLFAMAFSVIVLSELVKLFMRLADRKHKR